MQTKCLFQCTDKRYKICSLYVNDDNSFVMSNIWDVNFVHMLLVDTLIKYIT